MMKRRNLHTSGKFFLIGLLALLVGYVIYDNPEDVETQSYRSLGESTSTSPQFHDPLKDSLVEFGLELLGTPYAVAGNGEDGFDCSGFVYFVFQNFDINVPRSSAAFEDFGTEIPIEEVEKGDLLLFLSPTRNAIGHIGIVSTANGSESDFIHASSGREMKVIITNLSNEGYTRRFVKVIRVL